MPYLTIKKEQAILALEAQNLKSKFNATYLRWNPEVKNDRYKQLQQIKEACQLLNQRGTDESRYKRHANID